MKKLTLLFVLCAGAGAAVGCKAQVPQTPVYACNPVATSGTPNYTPLNPPANDTVPASITGTSDSDTTAAGLTVCYEVQSWAIVPPALVYQSSVPSNVYGPVTVPAGYQVNLAWDAPAGASGYGYIVGRAAAVLVPAPGSPTTLTGASVAMLAPPLMGPQIAPQVAAQSQSGGGGTTVLVQGFVY